MRPVILASVRIPGRTPTDELSRDDLRSLTLAQPNARLTGFGNVAVRTRATGWSRPSTFLVADDPAGAPCQACSRADMEQIARAQDAHLASTGALRLRRRMGTSQACSVVTTLEIERTHAHIASVYDLLGHQVAG